MLALVIGAAAATSHAKLVAGALIGLMFFGVAIAVYLRDPIGALIGLWLIVVFNAPISAAVGYHSSAGEAVRQGDEVLVLLLLAVTTWHTLRTNTRISPLRFILPGIGVALLGLLGAALHDVPSAVTTVGGWLGLKFWIMVGITLMLPWGPDDLRRVYTVLTRVGIFVAVLGLLDYLTHAAVSRALGTSIYRFSSESFRGEAVHSIFPHPGEYSVFMSLLFAYSFARFASKRKTSDLMLALLFAGSIMLSLRLKGFLSLAAVLLIVAIFQGLTNHRGAIAVLLVGALLLVGIYSLEGNVIAKQISTYASSETTARARLYTAGERIAADNFPLGAGFGRYASYASRLYYSPVYKQYELNYDWGLSRAYPQFIDDTSWPSVIGETGYGGFATYLIGIMIIILAVIRRLRTAPIAMRWVPLATLCAIAAFLVDSLGDPALFDWVAVTTLAMMLGPTLAATRDFALFTEPGRLEEDHRQQTHG
ncbi:MAG TPA: hypothetical protein VNY31_05710 [Solirubrobacteraceae bacterium]|nr:hypothetical protein [Solirubrobacteraceae bacterium]